MPDAPIVLSYKPQPKQALLHASPANEILFGGAAGPGKSTALRNEGLIWALRIPRLQVYLFRRTFPELEKNHIIKSLEEFPRALGEYNQQHKRWTFTNQSILHMCHCQHEKNVFDYQGAEIHLLIIDELTTFTEFIYQYLRGRVRCTLDIPEQWRHKVPGILCGSNPGGIGHEFVKRTFVEFCGSKGGMRYASKRDGGMLRAYIPGHLKDNPLLLQTNPNYPAQLDALPEPYRTAYKKGDWDIFIGQMFNFNRRDHVVTPMPVPPKSTLYMTFDYGFAKPFSCGWWWRDEDDRLYRFTELYGWQPGQPDVGLRLGHREIAQRIKQHEELEGLTGRKIVRIADPTTMNKTPDARGGGQGPSLAADFAEEGLYLKPGDPSRKEKIRQFHQRLAIPKDRAGNPVDRPMMLVYDTCENFIRTIPLLAADSHNAEDVDTRMEDHVYDEAALICMERPLHAAAVQEHKGSVLEEAFNETPFGD